MSSAEWFSGKDGLPPKISLEDLFDGSEPTEVPAEHRPLATPSAQAQPQQPIPTKTEPELPKPGPAPIARDPPPTMEENQKSIASMASKFADKDESAESSDDETSSFEEVPKPVERPKASIALPSRTEEKSNGAPAIWSVPSHRESAVPTESAFSKPLPKAIDQPSTMSAPAGITHRSTSSQSSGTPGAAVAGLKEHLQDIKSMLETQNQTMLAQSEKLDLLAREVEMLKTRSTESGPRGADDMAKDERIRMLMLELDEARS